MHRETKMVDICASYVAQSLCCFLRFKNESQVWFDPTLAKNECYLKNYDSRPLVFDRNFLSCIHSRPELYQISNHV